MQRSKERYTQLFIQSYCNPYPYLMIVSHFNLWFLHKIDFSKMFNICFFTEFPFNLYWCNLFFKRSTGMASLMMFSKKNLGKCWTRHSYCDYFISQMQNISSSYGLLSFSDCALGTDLMILKWLLSTIRVQKFGLMSIKCLVRTFITR